MLVSGIELGKFLELLLCNPIWKMQQSGSISKSLLKGVVIEISVPNRNCSVIEKNTTHAKNVTSLSSTSCQI